MKSFKLIRSGASAAGFNMAMDEKIFKQYLEDGIGVLRIYRWEKPAFTYGFSQDPEELIDLGLCRDNGVELAKRITGGGVLFHNDEITYSFVCAKGDIAEPQGVFVAYRDICAFLLEFYRSLGLKPFFALQGQDFRQMSLPSELCSASFEKYDILIGGKKIGGNAQKRSRQAIFQHGSIPCSIDWDFLGKFLALPAKTASRVTSLSQELKTLPDKEVLEDKLIAAFESSFKVRFYETCLA